SDGLEFAGTGIRFVISGTFSIFNVFTLEATNLLLDISANGAGDTVVRVNGTARFPQLGGLELTLGDGGEAGGLTVNQTTGDWSLNGWRIVLPSYSAGKFSIEGLTLGFNQGNQDGDFLLLVAGSVRLFSGPAIMVRLELGQQKSVFIV